MLWTFGVIVNTVEPICIACIATPSLAALTNQQQKHHFVWSHSWLKCVQYVCIVVYFNLLKVDTWVLHWIHWSHKLKKIKKNSWMNAVVHMLPGQTLLKSKSLCTILYNILFIAGKYFRVWTGRFCAALHGGPSCPSTHSAFLAPLTRAAIHWHVDWRSGTQSKWLIFWISIGFFSWFFFSLVSWNIPLLTGQQTNTQVGCLSIWGQMRWYGMRYHLFLSGAFRHVRATNWCWMCPGGIKCAHASMQWMLMSSHKFWWKRDSTQMKIERL